jgi:hypothetical protein
VGSQLTLHMLINGRRRLVVSFAAAFLLSGVAGATAVPSQDSQTASEPVAARVIVDAADSSLFLIAGLAFGFIAAGTAFAIAVFTGVQALRPRTWIKHTGEVEEPSNRSDPRPTPAPAPPPPAQQEELVVALWRGYVKSRFFATSTEPDGTETTVAASPFFRPERKLPVEESVAARTAHADLARELAELGWEPVKTDATFASLFRRQSSATGEGGTASPDGSGRNQNA